MIVLPILFLGVGIAFVFFSKKIILWVVKGFYENNREYFISKGIAPPDKKNFTQYSKYMQWGHFTYSDSFALNLYRVWRIGGTIIGGMMIIASIAVIIEIIMN